MGAFNILLTEISCSNCHTKYQGRIQFKFGSTWQNEYYIGDKVKWGGNDIGTPNISKVKVYGILEDEKCPNCKQKNENKEFDIIVEADKISKVKILKDTRDYLANEGNYKILTN